jgi:uncharacterized protein (TIGR03118 family)
MNRFPFAIRTLTAVATAAALLAACGGGDDDAPSPAPAAALDADDADPATRAQVAEIMASVDAGVLTLGPDRSGDGGSQPGSGFGGYPGVTQTNLVANKPEYGAQFLEPDLQDAWGIAIRPAGAGGHFWVVADRTGKSIEYIGDVGGTPLFQDDLKLVDTHGPATGVVFNGGTQFVITQAHPSGAITGAAKFLFANASGSITAWTERALAGGGFDRPADSVVVVDGSARHSSFLGVALAPATDRMFVADFGAVPALRVYDGRFVEQAAVKNPFPPAAPGQAAEFEAFNVQTIGQSVFAMYARHVLPGPNAALPTEGRLAEFDAEGRFVARWWGRGYLNNPWGVALAPKDFGLYAGCLLVGNFGNGTLVAFHPRLKVALDYVRDDHGERVVIDGLWGLQFGNGASLGEANQLYFAAGPNKEADGLFGKLQANPRTLPRLGGLSMCR